MNLIQNVLQVIMISSLKIPEFVLKEIYFLQYSYPYDDVLDNKGAKFVSSNPVHDEVFSMQRYVIKFCQ